ncbi:MAG: hypothetical protein ABIJ59_03470 [Pseudomonadota bacterium]
MDRIIPDIEWYRRISQQLNLANRCPFSTINECPRYYQSVSLLGSVGFTELNAEKDKALLKKWKKSDLWPQIQEQATTVFGSPGRRKHLSNFCPEIIYDHFGMFATDISPYTDEIDHDGGIKFGVEQNLPKGHWIYDWSHVSKAHYSDCPLYSPLEKKNPNNSERTLYDEFVFRVKNNPFIAALIIAFIVLSAIATLWNTIVGLNNNYNKTSAEKIEFSQKKILLKSFQKYRDYLAYFVVTNKESHSLTPRNIVLNNLSIPVLFADDTDMALKVQDLHDSLSNGLNHVKSFPLLMSSKNFSKTNHDNLIHAIKKVIEHADEDGPIIAQSIGEQWEVPPKGFSNKELIDYYNSRLKMQDATGETAIIKLKG